MPLSAAEQIIESIGFLCQEPGKPQPHFAGYAKKNVVIGGGEGILTTKEMDKGR